MGSKLYAIMRSPRVKKGFLFVAFLALLFVVCNDFVMPWYVRKAGEVVVPTVVGMPFDVAEHRMDSAGLVARKGEQRTDNKYPLGTVINQNPIAGKTVNKGRRVYLAVSGGEQLVSMPNLKGRTLRDARFQLEQRGLKLGVIEYQPSNEFPENTVIDQKVSPGMKISTNVYVSIVASQGNISDKTAVPDLNGKTLAQAQQILLTHGFKLGNITYQHAPDLLPNTIVDQFPRVGEFAGRGQTIDVFVAQGSEKGNEVLEN